MFNKGLTIDQIAKERALVKTTIEGHLSFFVENGQLDIGKVLSSEKLGAIEEKFAAAPDASLTKVKKSLGDGFS